MTVYRTNQNNSKSSALSITILLIFPTLLALIPTVSAEGGGSLTTFSNGASTVDVETSSSYNSTISIDSPRNVTYQTASLELDYSSDDPSPGKVWPDINMDGTEEWAWNGTGMGSVGEQTTFVDGALNDSIAVSSGNNSSKGIILPTNAQLFSSELSSSFFSPVSFS